MLVPLYILVAVCDLHEPDPPLGKPSCHEALSTKILGDCIVEAVEFSGGLGFTRNILGLWHCRLHAEGQFKGSNPVFKLWMVSLQVLLVALVEFSDKPELLKLLPGFPLMVPDMANPGLAGGDAGIADRAALMVGGEKACAPVLDAAVGKGGADGDEGG